MRAFEFNSPINEQDLTEVAMSPGALISWAGSKDAQGIVAGFEAELIFRNTVNIEEKEFSREMEEFPNDKEASSIDDIIEFFSDNSDGRGLRPGDVEVFRERLEYDYNEWREQAIELLWQDIKKSKVREYMIMHVWDDDDAREEMIRGQLKDLGLEKYEIETAFDEGENNKYYRQAVSNAELELRTLAMVQIKQQGPYYKAARQEYRETYDDFNEFTQQEWLESEDLELMSKISERYAYKWPYEAKWKSPDRRTAHDIGSQIKKLLNARVALGHDYHDVERKPGRWILEPDPSIEPEDENIDAGIEIVSPPMPLIKTLADLDSLIDWAAGPGNAYTNESTGLHMSISLPEARSPVDYIKLILFMGDQYVLEQFQRTASIYCRSAVGKIQRALRSKDIEPELVLAEMKKGLGLRASQMLMNPIELGVDKYTSAHIRKNYIEFRSPGGDYISKYRKNSSELQNTMLRFARAMSLAANPEAEKQDYAKKLYKLVAPQGDDILKLFSELSAGNINVAQLKQKWSQAILKQDKEYTNKAGGMGSKEKHTWAVYNAETGETVARYENMTRAEIAKIANIEYSRRPDARFLRVRIESPNDISPRRITMARRLQQPNRN